MSEPLIRTENLKKYFQVREGTLHAVDDITLEIPKGKTLGLVGESGCGKSTLGRTLIRLLDPTSGKIYFQGQDITDVKGRQLRAMRKEMQIIFQDPLSSLDPRKPVHELIAEPLAAAKVCRSREERYRRVLEHTYTVGLARRFDSAYPHELDGGRRQRVGIARALALNPSFIVCDEPVSSLDVSIQAQILNLLMDLQEERALTYLFITHDLLVVRHISDEIMVMYLGQCVEKAPSDELFKHPLHPYTKALLSAIPVPDIRMRRKPVMLEGEVTDPVDPKEGCRFAGRCSQCKEACLRTPYALQEVSPGHYTSCVLYRQNV